MPPSREGAAPPWREPGCGRSRVPSKPRDDGAGHAVTPGCRLWLDGWDAREGACDILELSPEGVTIALPDGRRSRWGQRGQLLIGQVGGDHYALPVSVRGVKPSPSAWIVELAFADDEPWAYRRG